MKFEEDWDQLQEKNCLHRQSHENKWYKENAIMEDQTKITWSLTCMKLIQVKLIFGNDLLVVRLVFFHHRLKEEVSFLVISIHQMLWWPKLESKISASIKSTKSVTTKVDNIIFMWSKKQLFELRGESHIDFRIDIDRRLPVGVWEGEGPLSIMTFWNLEKLSNLKVHVLYNLLFLCLSSHQLKTVLSIKKVFKNLQN